MKPNLFRIALLLIFAVILFSTSQSNAQEGAKTAIDGIYFQGNSLHYRIFEFKNGWLKIKTNRGAELRGKVNFQSSPNSKRGIVSIEYYDGQQNIELSTTYTILEQKLWLGTFNQTSYRTKPCYLSVVQDAGMLGMSNRACLQGKFYWYSKQGLGRFKPFDGPQPFGFKINKTETPDSDSFQIEIDTTSDFSAADAELLFSIKKPFTKSLPAYLKQDRVWKQMHGSEHNFRPLDEKSTVIVAPWSVCLGRVGLFAREVDEADLIGDWSDGSVVTKRPKQSPANQAAVFFPGIGLQERRTRERLKSLVYSPDPENFNFSRSSAAFNCTAGHQDVPGDVFWFPISDTEIAKFSSQPTHGWGSKFQQTVISRKTEPETEKETKTRPEKKAETETE